RPCRRAGPVRYFPACPPRRSSDLSRNAEVAMAVQGRDDGGPDQLDRGGWVPVRGQRDLAESQPLELQEALHAAIQPAPIAGQGRSEEHTSELQSRVDLVCRLLLDK